MSVFGKLLNSGNQTDDASAAASDSDESITDGALDTLGCVIRTMGEVSFPLADGKSPETFQEICGEFACHVENGAPVPALDIAQSADGRRQWSRIRRFFIDRRTDEKSFVTDRLGDYRGVVENLVEGMRQIGQRDQETEQRIRENLSLVENAIDNGNLPEVQAALRLTMDNIEETFARQKEEYENQISTLNDRMSNLREDLVAVQEETKRDPLTDAFNRGAFDEAIGKSMNMHFMLNQPLALLMIDLDNFKQVNDNHGHSAGDEVLRSVGECLARSFIRKSDFVARYGGDEFAVILPDTSAENARPLIVRFLENFAALDFPYATEDSKVSCSVGFTVAHNSDTALQLVERADSALYEAKAAGRHQFRFAPPPAS